MQLISRMVILGWEWLLGDSYRKFRLAAAKRMSSGWSVEMAEALAAEMGAQLTPLLHTTKLLLECDSMQVISKLNHSKGNQIEVGGDLPQYQPVPGTNGRGQMETYSI
ncbi:unnamed protein product [Linum trigynum]|uniref:RNase H type-1 domain-containing protein n=1 Tax=Linum trigynum TaxID=586398 RepID=A0AAV2DS84_9ROSI